VTGARTRKPRRFLVAICAAGFVLLVGLKLRTSLHAEEDPRLQQTIEISADIAQTWSDGELNIAIYHGNCQVVQGDTVIAGNQMVIWHRQFGDRDRVTVYVEGNVHFQQAGDSMSQPSMLLDLVSTGGIRGQLRVPVVEADGREDPLYRRGQRRRNGDDRENLQPTQMLVGQQPATSGPLLPGAGPSTGRRRIRILPRSRVKPNIQSRLSQETTPPEQIILINGGVNLVITGNELLRIGDERIQTIDLTADRVVIWTEPQAWNQNESEFAHSEEAMLQVYLEGNIVAMLDDRVMTASQMFFDARENRGLLLNSELKLPVPEIDRKLRVRAQKLRILSRSQYHAQQAWVSPSEFGKPGVRLDSSDIFIEDRYDQPWWGWGDQEVGFDPATGAPIVEPVPWVTMLDNRFLIEDFPVTYSPYLSAPAEIPNIPIRRLTVGNDSIFGTYVRTVWDAYSLFSIDRPPRGTEWSLIADGMTERGVGLGTAGTYQGQDTLWFPGRFQGDGLGMLNYDTGRDNLGADRRNLSVPGSYRTRLQWHHRQELPYQMTLFGEIGYLSDRNYLEQYWEKEFDDEKDNETYAALNQTYDNWSWNVLAKGRLNDFENETEWYPRLDGYVIGEPLFGGRLVWSTHSYAGYGRIRPADPPGATNDVFSPIPYVAPVGGSVLMTRHQLEAPFNLGPVKVSPFAMGEAAYWNEDLNGNDLDRLYGAAGVRSSLMIWKAMPHVHNELLNVNGLAHKIFLEADYVIGESNRNFNQIAQYNEFEDNAQERFRQRFLTNTYGGTLPLTNEPRFYAIRNQTGMAVTAPWHELVDDFHAATFAIRQRLQTKVGPPESPKIIDWMTFDVATSFFPNRDRDNFGEHFGLLTGDYRWNLGAETSFLAHAQTDFYDGAQHLWNAGIRSRRNDRGTFYFGYQQVQGARINSQFINATASYKMSPKWIASATTSYDLGESRNVGQTFMVTRVGADFLVHVGGTVDASKGNTGIGISVEPRFISRSSLNSRLGSLVGSE